MAGPFDDLIEKYSPRAAQAPGAGPFDDLIEKAKADRDPVAITQRIKTDPDFQPTDEQLDIAYAYKRSLPTLGEAWSGLKTFATETIPNLARKAREENPNPLAFLTSPAAAWSNLATGAEALLSGSQQLGQMVLPAIHSVTDAIANGLAAPVPLNAPDMPEKMAKQAWLERTRAAAENQRAMQPYQEGEQAFIPAAKPATAQLAANLGADPTILIPGAKAAGLLKFAAPAARTAATVAAEAAAKGGIARTALEVAAPAAEATAGKVGTVSDKAAEIIGKVQPVLDVGGFVHGGLPGAAGSRVAGTVARKAAEWAGKVSKMGTGLRNLAKADWASAQPVWQQLAKDADAPAWLVRASSSAVAPMVESTLRGAAAVGTGAVEGAAIGAAAAISDDTLTPEERGMAIGPGLLLGGLGAGFGHVAGSKSRAMLAQAHDIAVRADKTIKSGIDPALVLSTPDPVMYYADNVEKLFQGAMPGGKNLEVILTDSNGFAQFGFDQKAAAGYTQTPDGRYVAAINLESPSVLDTRAIHEGLGHAILDSVVGDRSQMLQQVRETFTPELLQRAAVQYARAMLPQGSIRDIKAYIDAKRADSLQRYGDADMWIAEELSAEAAVRRMGGRSVLDMASPSFLTRVVNKITGRVGERTVDADTSTFFSGLVRGQLDKLGETRANTTEQLGAFRPAIDTAPEPARPVKPSDWGKPHAPLHDLGNGTKGNDFVVQTVHGKLVKRTDVQVKRTAKARVEEVQKNVPENAAPLPIGSPNDEVRLRTSPSGLTERSGRKLGQWFYDSKVFGKHTKEFAKQLEDAIQNNSVLAGWYHQIGKGKDWARSVDTDKGNISAEYKDFVPVDFAISKAGNILVRNYSLTAFQRKAMAWGARHGDISLDLWNGDIGAFKADVDAYIQNHEDGKPGDTGIGSSKRDVINAFLVGGNRSFEAANPLRPLLRGDNRQGIIRSYRLDRIETLEPSSQAFGRPQYEKQLKNLSPEIQNENRGAAQPAAVGDQAAAGELSVPGGMGRGPGGVELPGAPADSSVPLRGLAARVRVPGRGEVTFGPFPKAREVAKAYAERAGISYNPPRDYVKVDPARASRIAAAFDAMPHSPDDPAVRASYDAMIAETLAQWEAIKESGLVVEPIPEGVADPYAASPRLAILDVLENNHLWFFPTDYGFGGSNTAHVDITGNPLMQHTGEVLNGRRLRANDVFRIVHDYFGHIKEGVGFRADGEENAWRVHSAMYSDLARPAMTTETRGQNSWVNFGPYSEFNRTASGAETQYAPQKIGLLPDWVINEGAKDTASYSPTVQYADGKSIAIFGRKYSELGPAQRADIDAYVKRYVEQNLPGDSNRATKSGNFKSWFGDWEDPNAYSSRRAGAPVSVVVGSDGAPLKVFHSTRADFTKFDTGRKTSNNYGFFGNSETERHAVFFTDSPSQSDSYSKTEGKFDPGSKTVPVYLSIKSPIDFRDSGFDFEALASELGLSYNYLRNVDHYWSLLDGPDGKEFVRRAKEAGYDGVIFNEDVLEDTATPGTTFAVFDSNQIKSAIGNSGAFDVANQDIRYSPTIPKSRKEFNPTYLPENQLNDFPNWQSTIARVGKKAGEELTTDLVVSGDLYMEGLPKEKHKIVRDILTNNPGMHDLPADLPEARRIFTERAVENLLAIWDAIPEEIRSRSKLWYEGGRAIVDRLATQYGVDPQQAAAVVAALSPQKGWQENVRLAHLIFEAHSTLQDQVTTQKQLLFLRQSALKAAEGAVAEEAGSLQAMNTRLNRLTNPKSVEKAQAEATQQQRKLARAEKKRDILKQLIPAMNGKTYGELPDNFSKAMWIRSWWDGEMGLKDVPDITPEGEFLPTFAKTELGKPVTLRWQSYDAIEKTLDVIQDNSRAAISDALGGAHKVRNFYNNLLLPNLREMQDVTVDTHAIAAGMFLPLGTSDFMTTWGMSGSPKSSTDVHGGYGFFADAYREAAKQRGALAREMQSVTWEGIRNLFSGSFKSANKDRIAAIWARAENGEITREQARNEIIAAAGGFKPPSWYGSGSAPQ